MSWLKLEVLLVMGSYAFVVFLIVLGKRKSARKSKLKESSLSKLEELSVVIPFRNEVENLPQLVQAIQTMSNLPLEFIFINDSSEDKSLDYLENIKWNCDVTILNTPKNSEGKKNAILQGISNAKGKYILTWDADIIPPSQFFERLEKFNWSALNILPVEMRDSKFIGGFFAWDYQLQTQTAKSMAGWGRPITCSGANLLFEKSSFLEAQEIRKDDKHMSGDDQFLLSAFRKLNKSISILDSKELTVVASPPITIKEGLSQRGRWLGKSKAVNDTFANGFGLLVLLIQISYYSFSFYQLAIGNFGATIVMILIKGELDAFICTYKFQEQFNTLQVFLYELLFPFYIIALLAFSFLTTPKWKGRSIKKPS